jgi:hypothetical protein
MPTIHGSLAERVAQRHGIVTADELIEHGFTANTIRRQVTSAALIRVHDGVFRTAVTLATFESECAAACIADDRIVITGVAAARLWKFHHCWLPEHPIVMTDHDRSPITTGVKMRRSNRLPPTDWVDRPDGIRVAAPPRAWFECGRDLHDEKYEMLTEFMIDRYCGIPTLWRTAQRLCARGRDGSARVRRVLSQRDVWQKPAGSGLELRVLKALEAAGVPTLVRQYRITLPNGIVIHCDGAIPAARWAVEVDHVTWHGGRSNAQRDKSRDRQLRKMRWHVDRVTDIELHDDFAGTIREVVDLYHDRRRALAA